MQQKIDITFSLIFFFFASLLILALLASIFMTNFTNLIPIMLKSGGYFVTISRILLFIGFVGSLYFCALNLKNKKKIHKFVLLGIALIAALFVICMLPDKYSDEYENVIEIYSFTESRTIFNSVRSFLLDYIVFICFIALPMIIFFARKRAIESYFYESAIREFAPSINVSIVFLFGYIIESYDLKSALWIFDLAVSALCIIFVLRIAVEIASNVTFFTVVNAAILVVGFVIIVLANAAFDNSNVHYASVLFYSIALLYWQANMLLKTSQAAH